MQANRNILLTGGSGFLGNIVKVSLASKGFEVTTVGRDPASDIPCDLVQCAPQVRKPIHILVHCAGRAHVVPKNTQQEREFFDINCSGTKNLLKGMEDSKFLPDSFVFISSIAVYGLICGEDVNETSPLLAADPYGRSKIEAEQIVRNWAAKHSIICSILRLPLLAGKNPPGNLGSMIAGIRQGLYLRIADRKARKSIVLAEDVAAAIPDIASVGGVYNLTDGYHPSFPELEDLIVAQTGAKRPLSISYPVARSLGFIGDLVDFIIPGKSPVTTRKIEKIVSTLTFDDQKARDAFGWNPRRVIDEFTV